MPNWCNNTITITGPTDTIKVLWSRATEDTSEDAGLLNGMFPMPQELHGTTSPSEEPNWYDWRVSNWSTKWDVSTEGLEFVDNEDGTASIDGWFDSAWSPPIGAYENFCANNEGCSVNASYFEPGMDFAGFWIEGEDECCENLQEQFNLPEDEQSDLFKRLDEEFDLSSQFAEYDEVEEEED